MTIKIYHYAKMKNPAKKEPYVLSKDEIICRVIRKLRKLKMNLQRIWDNDSGDTTMIFERIRND